MGAENQPFGRATAGLKTVTLMKRQSGLTHEAFVEAFTGEHADLAKRCPGLLRYSQTIVQSMSARPGMPSWDLDIDAIGQLYFEDQAQLDRFNAADETVALRAHGAAIVGQQINFITREFVPIPKHAPIEPQIKFVALLGRRADINHAEFLDAWLSDHARLAGNCPEIAQFVLTRVDEAKARPGMPSWDVEIEGMAELYFADAEMLAAFNAATTTKAFRAHGETFIGRQINLVTVEKRVAVQAASPVA